MASAHYTAPTLFCSKCKIHKRPDDFAKSASSKRGRAYRCKLCASSIARLKRIADSKDPKNCGVYEIVHTPSGRRYVGSSACLPSRESFHKSLLRRGIHNSKLLQAAYDADGAESIEFRHLFYCSREDLLVYEQIFIDSRDSAFNTLRIAGSGLGFSHTDEAKHKISMGNMGKERTEEVRARISKKLRGRKSDPEAVARRAEKLRGRKRPAEVVEKCRRAVAGKPKSDEHKANLAAAFERFTADEVRDMRSMHASGFLYREIAEKYGIHLGTVGKIIKRERYKWVD